jgi:Fe2+ or Zn2+ uptake regulation protein
MACFCCRAIMEYASSSFEKVREMATQSGFQIQVMRLEVGGLCKRRQRVGS